MHLDVVLVVASLLVGTLVGLTGVGGGALMTPMLVVVFGVSPASAIAADLVAALFMKPLGVLVHWRRGSVRTSLVRDLSVGSVPGALVGTFGLRLMSSHGSLLEHLLGIALIAGSLALFGRFIFQQRAHEATSQRRLLATCAVGLFGGVMVGLTSVGAGSLMVIALLLVHPDLSSNELVGTDLAQSIPLTLSASVGALLFTHVPGSLTLALILGSVPGVVIGSLVSARVRGPGLRLVVTGVILLTGLRYLGLGAWWLALVAVVLLGSGVLAWWGSRRRSVPKTIEQVGALLPARLDGDA